MHVVAAGQATSENAVAPGPSMTGAAESDQAEPFHRINTGRGARPWNQPTAQQELELEHATPRSTVLTAPEGFGLEGMAQFEPFHRSTSPLVTEELEE